MRCIEIYFSIGFILLTFPLFVSGLTRKRSVCDEPLGMESGRVPDTAITASSRWHAVSGPTRGRLNTPGEYLLSGGWSANYNDQEEWIQVDFGHAVKITAIATQGRADAPQWVTTYMLHYSQDDGYYQPYASNKVFQGNSDRNSVVKQIVDPPIIARFMQLNPRSWHEHVSLRLEVYGCRSGFNAPAVPQCGKRLGMESGLIRDEYITASSSWSSGSGPSQARLHLHRTAFTTGGWVAKYHDLYQWLQIMFPVFTKVTRISTQGRQDADQWITSYTVTYGYNGVLFLQYKAKGLTKVFSGNSDRYNTVSHLLETPIISKYIKLVPKAWHVKIAVRVEFYGCTTGFQIPVLQCVDALGMENKAIPQSAITASSSWHKVTGPQRGRLRMPVERSRAGGWASLHNDQNQWLQVNFGRLTKVIGVASQGRNGADQWVNQYTLSFSMDGTNFQPYDNKKVLNGNRDRDSIVFNIVDPPIVGRFIRVNPIKWHNHIAMRLEFYGCPGNSMTYIYRGCYKETAVRAIPTYIASYTGPDAIDKCYEAAKQRGFKAFGFISGVQCWSGSQVHLTYSMHGPSDGCKNGRGGNWAIDVYFVSKEFAFDGHWAAWGEWKMCSKTCGGGTETRMRTCTNPPPVDQGKDCVGASSETKICHTEACPAVDGVWSEWSKWLLCSKSCGGGTQTRMRTCSNPAPTNGGADCAGDNSQTQECNPISCPPPLDGMWSDWNQWTPCTKTCGGGEQSRMRTCTNPAPSHGGQNCAGDAVQKQVCNTDACPPVNGVWSPWSEWKTCSKTCGGGTQQRMRKCDDPAPAHGGQDCVGDSTKTQLCATATCPAPVHGSWSVWGEWKSCSKTCGDGVRRRSRTCTNPTQAHGGNDCVGDGTQTEHCNTATCPPIVDGHWAPWGEWGQCTKTCGGGARSRKRTCTNPPPANGGLDCAGHGLETIECNTKSCPPVDGVWSAWGEWGTCSKTCGGGTQQRLRRCENPAPAHGGQDCVGDSTETRPCATATCPPPLDGAWSEWSKWKPCSKTCGSGVKTRSRTCTNPSPAHGGKDCVGDNSQSEHCNTAVCPLSVDGAWTDWSAWKQCTKTCGGGIKTRTRTCTNPSPAHGGQNCIGSASETMSCNTETCPVLPIDGVWSQWSAWSKCTRSCDTGVQQRMRTCTNPAPAFGGKACPGFNSQVQACNTFTCSGGGGEGTSGGSSGESRTYYIYGGCFKDSAQRALPVFIESFKGQRDAVSKCVAAVKSRGFEVFALQSGGECWSGPQAQLTYAKHGPSSKCRDGKGGSWANDVYFMSVYLHKGCYKDTWDRSFRKYITSFKDRPDAAFQCYLKAKEKNFKAFAIQNKGECWTGPDSDVTYNKHGSSDRCQDGRGGPWANDVYFIGRFGAWNGAWSDWGAWSQCSKPCGTGMQTRSRTCTNPPPKNGGASCTGSASETKECSIMVCTAEYNHTGCYKDSWQRTLPKYLGTLRGDNVVRQCYLKVKELEYLVFGVQAGIECWTGENSHSTYYKQGQSNLCRGGTGGPWANDVYYIVRYHHIGCYKDEQDRALPTFLASFIGSGDAIERCYLKAHKKGFEMFSVQNGGECWSGSKAEDRYAKYGRSSDCHHGKGGKWASDVYTMNHPIDGQWSSWGSWAECSKTCGGGSQTRSRVCTSPAPENGGLPCQGSASDTKECKTFACSGSFIHVGCYKDNSVRVMPKYLGAFHNQDNAVIKCGNLASSKGYHAFGLQAGGECWSGPKAHMTYAERGMASNCKDGKGGGFSHDVYFVAKYSYKGCFKDARDRILPKYFGSFRRDDNKSIEKCLVKARERNYQAFGMQAGIECWSGPTANSTYNKHGVSSNCKGGVGGPWAADVYFNE